MDDAAHPWLDDLEVAELNSAQLRALAHPTRNRIVSSLRMEGPATSARLAERLATNTGQTSYHLRTLADVGLIVEDTEAGTARERWWRAAHRGHSWSEPTFAGDDEDAAAADWLVRYYQGMYRRWADEWLDRRHGWPEEWQAAATMGDAFLHLDVARAQSFASELGALIERYRELPAPAGDSHEVFFNYQLFPVDGMRP